MARLEFGFVKEILTRSDILFLLAVVLVIITLLLVYVIFFSKRIKNYLAERKRERLRERLRNKLLEIELRQSAGK